MTAERFARVEALFAAALERPAAERAEYLRVACGEDRELYAEVEALLAADREAGRFIEAAVDAGAAAFAAGWEAAQIGRRIGRWEIVRELGRGGMSSVFLARRADRQFRQEVAMKLVRRGMDTEDILARFRGERQILAGLDHPNIARLFDGGTTDDGLPFFVMEHIEGEPIDRYCDARRMSIRERLELFRTVCAAVHYAHRNLVIHRDIKPRNVLVTAGGVPKLLDFGIAKLLAAAHAGVTASATAAAQRPMTPAYASPEQFRGGAVTTASDVYSLGVLLYELLTGRRPYRLAGAGPGEAERRVCELAPEKPSQAVLRLEDEPDDRDPSGTEAPLHTPESVSRARGGSPRLLRRRLAGDLDNVVMMALRKEPERRYGSVEQLAEDVGRHLAGHPVIARRDRFGYRAAKFVRRHLMATAAAVAFVALAVAFSVAVAIQAARTARERDRVEEVADLLRELFEIADPGEARGESITARELLDRGAQRVAELDDDRESAMLMETLASLYEELGLYDRAAPLHRRALAIRRRELGAEHAEVAESLNSLGRLRALQGDFAGAKPLFQEALDIRRRALGETHEQVAQSLNNLALVTHDLGHYQQALPLYRQTLEVDRKTQGDDHPATAITAGNLALLLYDVGDYAASERLYDEVLATRRKHLGPEHHDIASALDELGVVRHARGDLDGAEPLLRSAVAMRRRMLGDEHPELARGLVHLGALLVDRGALAEAEAALLRSLEIRRSALGEGHEETAASLEALAALRAAQGDGQAAEALLEEAIAIYRESHPGGHPLEARALLALGELLETRAACARAEPRLRSALALRRRLLPAESWLTAEAENVLGGCLASTGRPAAARRLLSASTPRIVAQLGPEHPRARRARGRLERLASSGPSGSGPSGPT